MQYRSHMGFCRQHSSNLCRPPSISRAAALHHSCLERLSPRTEWEAYLRKHRARRTCYRNLHSRRHRQRGPAVTPVNYRLSIFDLKFAPEWQFSGSVVIEARVARPITEVVLHAAALDITTTELSQGSEDTTRT